MKTTLFALVTFAASGLLVGATPARADHDFDCGPIEDLAAHVQDHSRELYREVQIHVGYSSAGRHLLSDVATLYRSAGRIRAYAHAGVSLSQLCREGERLDDLMHHVEEIVDELDHAHHDHHGHYSHGHNDLRHLRKLIRLIEDDTHQLMDEIESLERHLARRPIYSRPGISVGPGGLHLGGHGISVKFVK